MVDPLLLGPLSELPAVAWDKARRAHGVSVDRSWEGALRSMRALPSVVERVFAWLRVWPASGEIATRRLASFTADEDDSP